MKKQYYLYLIGAVVIGYYLLKKFNYLSKITDAFNKVKNAMK
jgi:hypothetical protein